MLNLNVFHHFLERKGTKANKILIIFHQSTLIEYFSLLFLTTMASSFYAVIWGLFMLLLGVIATPPSTNPCSDPSSPNYNAVIPVRRSSSYDEYLGITDGNYTLVDGCYVLQPGGLTVYSHTASDSPLSSSINLYSYLVDTCTGNYWYLNAYQTYYNQKFWSKSPNDNQITLSGLFVINGYTYGSEGTTFSFTTTPVTFRSNSQPVTKSESRSESRNDGSHCRISGTNSYTSSNYLSTTGMTFSIDLAGHGNLTFVYPSTFPAYWATSASDYTLHQCTCNGL